MEPAEGPEALEAHEWSRAGPMPAPRSRSGSIGVAVVPILMSAAALARRSSSQERPTGPVALTLPSAVLTRRASVDRGSTPMDALFSPNYHTPPGESANTATDGVPAATFWTEDRTPSRRSSVGSSLDTSFLANLNMHGLGSHDLPSVPSSSQGTSGATDGADAAAPLAMSHSSSLTSLLLPMLSAAAVAAPVSPSAAMDMVDDASESEGAPLVPAGAVILEAPAMLLPWAAQLPRHLLAGPWASLELEHLSAVSTLMRTTPVADLVDAAHKTAEAAIQAEFDPYGPFPPPPPQGA